MCIRDSEFASLQKKEEVAEIKLLKIEVRLLNEEDINKRQLPASTTGVVITSIAPDSPVNKYMQVNDIIVEIQKTEISNLKQLNDILDKSTTENENTLLFTIYSNLNQRRYIGIKLK